MKNFITIMIFLLIIIFSQTSCKSNNNKNDIQQNINKDTIVKQDSKNIIVGAEQTELYLDLIKNKNIALVVNQTATIKSIHLVDSLLKLGIIIKKVFAPEHGFRGNIDAGGVVNSEIDEKTGIKIVTIFGDKKKPTTEDLSDIDIVIFDIQDVGARFYTFISSMHYVMEACAENNKKLIILDRSNPNGDQVDGPIRQAGFESFVSLDKIPIVHGLTVGELAQMINGEKWLKNGVVCDLQIIKCLNYNHSSKYSLPIKPSPNLPNDISIRLYPSLCFFEATNVSIGRGTEFPFQVIGYPDKKFGTFTFTPQDIEGMQTNPLQEGKLCYGVDLRNESLDSKFTLKYLIDFYKIYGSDDFFVRAKWFNLLAGNDKLIEQIKKGMTEEEIKASWKTELEEYKKIRKKYLLYNDFE